MFPKSIINLNRQIFTINSRKYDGTINRAWQCELIESENSLFILRGIFEKEVNHSQIGVIRRGTISTEYFWINRWFNVFKFINPDGGLLGFYCNINQPPTISDSILDFVDLDLDIFVNSNFEVTILDEDEFRENSEKYKYSQTVVSKVAETVDELLEMIEKRVFPFDSV